MNLALIVAVSENNVIGIKNKIPWKITEDMIRFKELTINHPVIMGRKTYESIPNKFKPLPQRKNIILSRSLENQEGIYIANNIDEALNLTDKKDSYVIGGARVYKAFLPLANRIELTRVYEKYNGDVFFPEINWDEWKLVNRINRTQNKLKFSFMTYEKSKNQNL